MRSRRAAARRRPIRDRRAVGLRSGRRIGGGRVGRRRGGAWRRCGRTRVATGWRARRPRRRRRSGQVRLTAGCRRRRRPTPWYSGSDSARLPRVGSLARRRDRRVRRAGSIRADRGAIASSSRPQSRLTRSSRRAISAIDGQRASASRSRQLAISASSDGTIARARARSAGGGVSCRILSASAAKPSPRNGASPVAARYIITPSAHTSVRASTGLPLICSGLMYCGVPITEPATVRPGDRALAAQLRDAEVEHLDEVGIALARDHEHVRRLEIAMDDLLGVRRGERLADLAEHVQQQRHRHRPPLAHQIVERLALEILHHEVDAAVGAVAVVVDVDDVRVIDEVDGLGLLQEPRDDRARASRARGGAS